MLDLLFRYKYFLLSVFVIFFLYLNYQIFIPPKNFPTEKIFEIKRGESAAIVFAKLEKEGYIHNVFWAKVLSKIFQYKNFYPGEYKFEKKLSLHEVLFSVTRKPPSYAILIPEGFTKKQIVERLSRYIPSLDKKKFLEEAPEGYLFPDTYYFYKYSSNEEILKAFADKFQSESIKNFGKIPTKNEVIIASMLEREARELEDMKIIAGIYENRLKIGMPLQVDATVLYGQGIWKDRVYYSDLKYESDYNTYINRGLPPGPISNPGIKSLTAVLNPTKSHYLYYLTGKDGKMYYAKDFAAHVKNKLKYLK